MHTPRCGRRRMQRRSVRVRPSLLSGSASHLQFATCTSPSSPPNPCRLTIIISSAEPMVKRRLHGGAERQNGLAYLFNFDWNVVLCKEHFKSPGIGFGTCAGMCCCPLLIYILVR